MSTEQSKKTVHTHDFVETYQGLVGFGLDRPTDERTLAYYLQKFSDDQVLQTLLPRLSRKECDNLFTLLTDLLQNHLSESEYHRVFLKDRGPV